MMAEWCDFAREGVLCSQPVQGGTSNCTTRSALCNWFEPDAPLSVIFSDRLVKTGMVTMTSLCRHPTPMNVLVFMRVTRHHQPLPERYLSCRVISMTLEGSIDHLRKVGWRPDDICDPPGGDAHGRVRQPTLLGAAAWDKDPKHASCANHLRFYMPEFPVLRRHRRVLFVDDDVVVMRDAAELFRRVLPAGHLLTANCDVNLWNDRCQRFDVGRSIYSHFFAQAVVPQGAWAKVEALLANASGGAMRYDPNHFEWNFGFNLMDLDAHR